MRMSSPFLVYLCGRITAPLTGLACTLYHFESVSVVSCVHRYFLWRCVCIIIFEWGKKVWMSPISQVIWSHMIVLWKRLKFKSLWSTILLDSSGHHLLSLNGKELLGHSGKRLFFTEKSKSYWFQKTWGWVNDDRILHLVWTAPLRLDLHNPLTFELLDR